MFYTHIVKLHIVNHALLMSRERGFVTTPKNIIDLYAYMQQQGNTSKAWI